MQVLWYLYRSGRVALAKVNCRGFPLFSLEHTHTNTRTHPHTGPNINWASTSMGNLSPCLSVVVVYVQLGDRNAFHGKFAESIIWHWHIPNRGPPNWPLVGFPFSSPLKGWPRTKHAQVEFGALMVGVHKLGERTRRS